MNHNKRAAYYSARRVFNVALCLLFGCLMTNMVTAQTLSLGRDFAAFVDADGNLFMWGANANGQLGQGDTVDRALPVQVLPAGVWESVSVSNGGSGDTVLPGFVLAVRNDGTLWAWGANQDGQLGIGNQTQRTTPVRVGQGSNWAEVSAGGAFSVARNADGQVFVWGSNQSGQLARPLTTQRSSSPSALHSSGSPTYQSISAGNAHVLAIRSDGGLFGWGQGLAGQIGHTPNQVFSPVTAPQQVSAWTDWVSIAAGDIHSHGIRANGQLYSWGSGPALGVGTGGTVNTPQLVSGSLSFSSIATFSLSSFALATNGDAYGLGVNNSVELGVPWIIPQPDGTLVQNFQDAIFSSPRLLPISNVSAFSVGHSFSAVLVGDSVLTTGINTVGQLGKGFADPEVQSGQGPGYEASVLGNPDLRVDNVIKSSSDLVPGSTLNLQIFLSNVGTGPIEAGVAGLVLIAELSPESVPGAQDALDLSFVGSGLSLPLPQEIPAGEDVVVNAAVEIPASVPAGDYFIVVTADPAEVLEDANRDNNTFATEEPLSFVPDLTVAVDAPAAPISVAHSDSLDVAVTVSNTGNGSLAAGTSVALDLFLSPAASTTASGRRNLRQDIRIEDALPAGSSVTLSFTGPDAFVIDESYPAGTYFVGATVDPADAITELSETNNSSFTASALVTVTGLSLADALQETSTLSFTTSGDQLWFGQTASFVQGTSAAQSPSLAEGQSSSIETSLPFTSVVTFQWRAQTSSPQNFLSFQINGIEQPEGRIFGNTDWEEVSFLAPGNSPISWLYNQGTGASGDRVFLDAVSFERVVDPDFIIQSISGVSGTYVLGSNDTELTPTLLAKNQGSSATVGADFQIDFYLSPDNAFGNGTEVLVGSSNPFSGTRTWSANELITLTPRIDLPNNLSSGTYFLIAVINATETVQEIPGFGEENNVFVNEPANVAIEARPDLRVSSITTTPGYYGVGDVFNLTFEIENVGLSTVSQNIPVRLILSPDSNIGDSNDFIIEEFNVIDGIAPGNTITVNPSVLQVSSAFPKGERLYLGVHIDPNNTIPEIRTNNNTAFFPARDFIFNEIPVETVMGFDAEGLDLQMDTTAPFGDGQPFPFVGQSAVSIEGNGAAQSVGIERGESGAFGTTIVTETPTVISFFWRVSCDPVFDRLNFSVNNTVVRTISGSRDWARVSVPLPAGTHVLEWEYEKDILPPGASANSGTDRAWVAAFNSQLPDLVVDDLLFPSGAFAPGTPLTPFEVTIRNIGQADAVGTPSYDIEFRLTQSPTWGGDGDIVLGRVTNDQLLSPGTSRTFSLEFNIPSFAPNGLYYLGAFVDPDNVLNESRETNNDRFTSSRVIEVVSPIPLEDAANHPGVWEAGGTLGWFSVADAALPDGSRTTIDGVAALQSAPIGVGEESWVQTTVEGPKVLTFDVKVSSRQSLNPLEVSFDGITQTTLSGDIDWNFGIGGYTLTFNGETTDGISSGATTAEIEAALNALSSISSVGGVSVSGDGLVFTVTFNNNGNRPPLQITPRRPDRIVSASVATINAGNSSNPSVQEVSVLHNVGFRANHRGQLSALIPFNATAEEVEDILNATPNIIADGGVTVTGADLDFEIAFNETGEQQQILVDAGGLRRPGTVSTDIITPGGPTTAQTQQLSISPTVTLFVPAGTRQVRWTYSKTGTGGDFLDAAWIDNVNFEAWNDPELAITAVNYTPGVYTLDVDGAVDSSGNAVPEQLLETRFFDISVEAENLGLPLEGETDIATVADIQVWLSLDRNFGNEDDILLGSFSSVQGNFDSNLGVRFLGPIPLGDQIPAGDYYVIVLLNPAERITEYTLENNIFVSESADVTIERLPKLRLRDINILSDGSTNPPVQDLDGNLAVRGVAFDGNRVYLAGEAVRAEMTIENRGLGDALASQNWGIELSLRAFDLAELDGPALSDVISASSDPFLLNTFSAQQLSLQGRREGQEAGDSVTFELEWILPVEQQLQEIVDDALLEGGFLDTLLFYYQVEIVPDNSAFRMSDFFRTFQAFDYPLLESLLVPGTSPLQSILDSNLGMFSLLSNNQYFQGNTEQTFNRWSTEVYPGVGSVTFEDYAFNQTPGSGITGTLGRSEQVEEDGSVIEFSTLTFDIQRYGVDVIYEVFADGESILTIEPPYTALVGPNSLTGDGGLFDTNRDIVLSIVEFGSELFGGDEFGPYARVTVRDPEFRVAERELSVQASQISPASTWFSGASQLSNGWLYYDWFKGFQPSSGNWIFHARHGWLYVLGEDTQGLFLWDASMQRWLWTNESVYPWVYAYGPDEGWLFFFEGGSPGNRWFRRGDDGSLVFEDDLRVD